MGVSRYETRRGGPEVGRRGLPVTAPARLATAAPQGVIAIFILAVGNLALWVIARPAGVPTGQFIGELCGAEAVLLFSCALVLATVARPVEHAFGGLDRVALWHRRAAVAGVLLLVPHVALVTSSSDRYAKSIGPALGDIALLGLIVLSLWALAPGLRVARWPGLIARMARATYERWLGAHRLMGLFVIAALVHAAIVDPVLHRSPVLRVAFLLVALTGTAAYLYRELLARYFIPIFDYQVTAVHRLNKSSLDVEFEPVREAMSFTPGQFVFLELGGPGAWERHPFSVSSAPTDPCLRLTIKASGDYTQQLYDRLKPGVPAKLAGPFGGFDYRKGGSQQVWIAGGIGVTPFMSWIRSLDDSPDREISFYYSVAHADDAVHLDEIREAVGRHQALSLHLVCADTDGRLTPAQVIGAIPHGTDPWVFMCGPPPMMASFSNALQQDGIPSTHVRWEKFGAR